MLSNKFCIFTVVLSSIAVAPALAADPAAALAACPAHLTEGGKFHMLLAMTLLDGPAKDNSEVIPTQTGRTMTWDVAAIRAAGAVPTLACTFKHTGKIVTLAVPNEAGSCSFVAGYPARSSCQ